MNTLELSGKYVIRLPRFPETNLAARNIMNKQRGCNGVGRKKQRISAQYIVFFMSPKSKSTSSKDALMANQSSVGGSALSDVPEESGSTGTMTPTARLSNSPYFNPTHHQAAASTSTFNVSAPQPLPAAAATAPNTPTSASNGQTVSRKSSGMRSTSERLGRETTGSNGSLRKQALAPTERESGSGNKRVSSSAELKPKARAVPRLPHSDSVPPAPTTGMYWSRAPVFGDIPGRSMKAHSATVVDNVVWVFGGCDEKGCFRDVYCFDTGMCYLSGPIIQTPC